MKTLLTLLLSVMATAGFAQYSCVWVTPPTPSKKSIFEDTLLNKLIKERRNAAGKQQQKEELYRKLALAKKNQHPSGNMPNAIDITSVLTPVHDGNNEMGFDIYRSQLDNMPILMPDSANGASLKIKTDARIQPKKIYSIPKN